MDQLTIVGNTEQVNDLTLDALRYVSRQTHARFDPDTGFTYERPRVDITVDYIDYSDLILFDLGRNEFGLYREEPRVGGDLDRAVHRFDGATARVSRIEIRKRKET